MSPPGCYAQRVEAGGCRERCQHSPHSEFASAHCTDTLPRAQKEVSLLENVTEAIKKTLGRLLRPSDAGPSPDEEVAAAWGRVDQKKDQVRLFIVAEGCCAIVTGASVAPICYMNTNDLPWCALLCSQVHSFCTASSDGSSCAVPSCSKAGLRPYNPQTFCEAAPHDTVR